ncbi:MAG: hypothetical protein CO108_14985 [Deltaproteobacteria bacterium CG_4_9_14_3_um_filter_63_12]|nr:MAG: hypothetical protein COW42_09145 [Deltaproteobacteria bacterium CG17_big_fil_post_rev_8_21_14_2_50_63_7]PJB40373.1 MAG: hypothetical protein CO108_14985 [Deltaproteobacteria bacterium CG_4_9_14_3_um_filter_63_12]
MRILLAMAALAFWFPVNPIVVPVETPVDNGTVLLHGVGALEPGSGVEGVLSSQMAAELRESGGALLISGRSETPCSVWVRFGEVSDEIVLGPQLHVSYLPLEDVGNNAALWSLNGGECGVQLEGAVLFVGEAAAYVGDSPETYWQEYRGEIAPAVR